MKIQFTALLLFFCQLSNAQKFGDTSSFLLKGNIKNFKAGYFEYAVTGLFETSLSSVMVDSNGSFTKRISIENDQQDIYLYLNNDAIALTVMKDDTLNLNWDQDIFNKTFKIIAQNKERQNVLNTQWAGYLNFRQISLALPRNLYEDKTLNDSTKFRLVNSLFNKEVKLLADSCAYSSFFSMYPDIYFKYTNLLQSHRLVPKYSLVVDTVAIKETGLKQFTKFTIPQMLDEGLFWKSENYREFLYNYPRFEHLFYSYSGKGQDNFNPTLSNYYLAKGVMNIIPIRDWFVTKNILMDYGWYKFDDVANVSELFQKDLADPYLRQLLINKYRAVKTLKPGQPAPAFSLKNEESKNVSLSDFKGKVVYLDFWGVGCGPCIYDIDHNAKKLHEAYKGKNIVFISICVDSDEKEWKDGLQKHGMTEGVNLIAEGWTNNPVCKTYNITGIPHYILIDKAGRIINNNALGMGDLLQKTGNNEIDNALK